MQRAWGQKELGLRSTEEVVRLRAGWEKGRVVGGRGECSAEARSHRTLG